MNVERKVVRIISRAAQVPTGKIRPEVRLSDLGMESLDRIECVLAMEETFHIEIGDADLWRLRTVQDVIEVVKRVLPARRVE